MKRSLSFFVAVVFLIGVFASPVNAADKDYNNEILYYSFDSANEYKPPKCTIINGVPNIYLVGDGFTGNMDVLSSWYKYDAKNGKLEFKYSNHSGSLKVGSKTAYLDGKAVELSHAPEQIGSSMYVSMSTITKLFDFKATVVTKTFSSGDYAYDYKGTADNRTRDTIFTSKGEKVRFYRITYDPGKTNYTDSQITFMQGLAAPIFLHNIHQGYPNRRDDFSDKELSMHVKQLRPISGVLAIPLLRDAFRDTIRVMWGITTRDQLIESIESLIKSGNGTDKRLVAYDNSRAVQLAQIGYLQNWLTAEETITYGMKAAKQAQKGFTSWSEFGDYYMQNGAIQGPAARQKYINFLYKGDAFQKVGWNISLTAPAKTKS